MTLVRRIPKGSPLTAAEHDGNLDHLETDIIKLQTSNTLLTASVNALGVTNVNRIVSGFVRYTGVGLIWQSVNLVVEINGVIYTSHLQNVEQEPADTSKPRIDTIFMSSAGLAIKKGYATDPPYEPVLDNPDDEIKISLVLINPNEFVPEGVNYTKVYTNNNQEVGGEWNTVADAGTYFFDLASTLEPISGANSIASINVVTDKIGVTFSHSIPMYLNEFKNIRLDLRNDGNDWLTDFLEFRFYDGIEFVGSGVIDGSYIDMRNTTTSQEITLLDQNITWSGASNKFDSFKIRFRSVTENAPTKIAITIDNIFIETGTNIVTVPETETMIQPTVNWVSGLSFDCTAPYTKIGAKFYVANPTTVTLDAADATLDRIDLIVVKKPTAPETIATIEFLKGDLATSTLIVPPDYDPNLYYVIKQVIVQANATVPTDSSGTTMNTENVYIDGNGEPNEWTVALAGNIVNSVGELNATNSTYSTKATLTNNEDVTGLDSSGNFSLQFDITLKANLGSNFIFVKLFNENGAQLNSSLLFNNEKFNFNANSLLKQTITINGSVFSFSSTGNIRAIQIYPFANNYAGYILDNIKFNIGSGVISVPTVGTEKTKLSEFINDLPTNNTVGLIELKPEVIDNVVWKEELYYNTKIGGIGATTTTATALATLLGILETDIENFRIDGTDILCKINVDYVIPIDAFNLNTELTSYYDYNGKVTEILQRSFRGTTNTTHYYFPKCTRVWENGFANGGLAKELIYIPSCTILGTVVDPADNDYVFWYGTFNNCTLVIHPFMEFANAGGVEADIVLNLSNASYAFKEVIYSEQPVQVNGKMYGKDSVYDLRKENKIVTLATDVIDWIDPNSTFIRTFTGTPTVTFTEIKKPLDVIVKTITINMTGAVTSIAFPATYKKMESSADYDGTKMNKYVFEYVNGRVDYSNSLSPL